MNAKENKSAVVVDPRQQAIAANWPSVNALAAPLVRDLILQAKNLRLGVQRLDNGCVLVDAGIASRGGLHAGLRIADICMAGLGSASLVPVTGSRSEWGGSVPCLDPGPASRGRQYPRWALWPGGCEGR